MNPNTPIDRLSAWLGEKVAWLFFIAAVLTCLEVLLDSAFDSPTIWVHDSTIMLCATAFLLGGAYAMQRREHIRITVLYDFLPRRARRVCDVIALLLGIAYLGVLTIMTGMQAFESISIVERSGRAWDFPMPMVIRTALFLGSAMFLVQTMANLASALRGREEG